MLTDIAQSWNDRLLRLAFFCIIITGLAVSAVIPFQSVIGIERLGFTPGAYALITTAGSLFSVAASVTVGVYSDQTGRYRQVLQGCNLVGILGGLSMVVLPSKATFVLAHVVLLPIAVTTFAQYFAMASIAARENPALNKDVSLALVRAAFAGAFGLTPPILAIAVSQGMDLMLVYGVVAAANALILFLVVRSWPRDQEGASRDSGLGFFQSLKELSEPRILFRLLLVSVISGLNLLYNILLGLLILNNLGGSEADIGKFAGGVALIEVPIMLLVAWALKHSSQSGLLMLGTLIYASFMATMSSVSSMSAAWALMVPAGIGAGIVLSVMVGYVQDLVADRPGAGSSLVSVTHFGGMIFASAVFAAAATFTDYSGTALIGALLALGAGILLFAIDGARFRKRVEV